MTSPGWRGMMCELVSRGCDVSQDKKLKFLCDSCFEGAIEVGEVFAGYYLILYEEKLSLVCEPCHSDHLLFTFKSPPMPEVVPRLPGETSEEYDQRYNLLSHEEIEMDLERIAHGQGAMDEWLMGPNEAECLVNDCLKAGFCHDVDGDMGWWIYERCASTWDAYQARSWG